MMNNIKSINIDIIKYPIITDKSTQLLEENQYSFAVDNKADKTDIKTIIEYTFNVKVKNINTCNIHPKKKRVGKFIGYKKRYKKAIITLKNNYSINLFPEN
uniref:ribosomal protein L23 n=1 Tax=Hypnea brasiliensis TaxID=1866962 RepID=UPI0023F148BD|nr:ribosomal protein L23 [Hypnea brasiliensis]WCH55368.1 ribosomal protein L23 [Hypnea brasiliensis]WDY84841.1 ribosomal protein L23 [Hypnea brasiliensis]